MRVYEINPNLILISNQTLRHYLYTDFAKKFSLDKSSSSSSVSNSGSGRALICVPFTLEKIQNETGYGSSMRQLPHHSDTEVVDRCDSAAWATSSHLQISDVHWWPALAALSGLACQVAIVKSISSSAARTSIVSAPLLPPPHPQMLCLFTIYENKWTNDINNKKTNANRNT